MSGCPREELVDRHFECLGDAVEGADARLELAAEEAVELGATQADKVRLFGDRLGALCSCGALEDVSLERA